MLNKILTKTLKTLGYALETREEALEFAEYMKCSYLSSKPGIIFNYVGEHTHDFNEIYRTFIHYYALLQHIAEGGHERDLSIKMSQFLDYPYFIGRLVKEMLYKKRVIWIDGEEYDKAEGQLIMAKYLAERFSNKAYAFCPVGLTIQLKSNTYFEDAKACFEKGIKVRLCKGAYPSKIKKEELIIRAERIIRGGKTAKSNLLEIATTEDIDLVMIAFEHKLPLQLLYGWHKKFIEYPYGVKIYTPFGHNWWPYIVRRIKEKAKR